MNEEDEYCGYIPGSNDPCATCPRLISCLYMCRLLQEVFKEDGKNDGED